MPHDLKEVQQKVDLHESEINSKLDKLRHKLAKIDDDLSVINNKQNNTFNKQIAKIEELQIRNSNLSKQNDELKNEIKSLLKDKNNLRTSLQEKEKQLSDYWETIQKLRIKGRLKRLLPQFFFSSKENELNRNEDSILESYDSNESSPKKKLSKKLTIDLKSQKKLNKEIRGLWYNYSEETLFDLNRILSDTKSNPPTISYISYHIALWYAAINNWKESLHFQSKIVENTLPKELISQVVLLKFFTKLHLKENVGESLLLPKNNANDIALRFLEAFSTEMEKGQKAFENCLNQTYQSIESVNFFKNSGANTSKGIAKNSRLNVPEVTIFLPYFAPNDSLPVVLESLTNQSIRITKIVIITNQELNVNNALSVGDENIQLIKVPSPSEFISTVNQLILTVSTEFILVMTELGVIQFNLIEKMTAEFENDSDIKLLFPVTARVNRNFEFIPYLSDQGVSLTSNTDISCCLIKSQVLNENSGFFNIKTDSLFEFKSRLESLYSKGSCKEFRTALPSYIEINPDEKDIKSEYFGAVREFRESRKFLFKKNVSDGSPDISRVPNYLTYDVNNKKRYDLIVIADFNLNGGAYVSTFHYVKAALASLLNVAIVQWRRYDLNPELELKDEVRQLIADSKIDILTFEDIAETDTVIVGYPVIANKKLDLVPNIKCNNFLVLVNQSAERLYTGEDVAYVPTEVYNKLQNLFNTNPTWVPISGIIRNLMIGDDRFENCHKENWTPLIDIDQWCTNDLFWRREEHKIPVIGRHSRDHYTKWPSDRESLISAYCVNKDCEFRVLGGADHAINLIGFNPENWNVLNFEPNPQVFLSQLDFFIHYPHEECVEAFGRAVLEAMAMGIPVILPPIFKDTFEDYALYAEPEHVWDKISALWDDEKKYLAQASLSRKFVLERAGYNQLKGRLKRLN
ncbi:glycosyltransferase [Fulvivirga lutea]|uniref:Glycosyltransferase n=1 Tax=Fulvivirga lutea TaxID=2810512 RepID=A0A974WIJ7_9BACT|nr:hypothetical protein [Fulvivirga lutea]QSE98408.1 hypothetical protein JR347_04845 [Fulvivirga lutea]